VVRDFFTGRGTYIETLERRKTRERMDVLRAKKAAKRDQLAARKSKKGKALDAADGRMMRKVNRNRTCS
jgi:hypothetical protein